MYKRILVPIDFTEKSHRALEVACQIAKKLDSEVYMMHIVKAALSVYLDELGEYKSKTPTGQQFLDDILSLNEEKMKRLIQKYEDRGITIHSKLKVHDTPNEIAKLVAEEAFDLTVVGNYEHERFDEVFRRTHPEKIAALAKNPVLTINNAQDSFEIKRILIPTNLTDDYSPAMPDLMKFAESFNAELTFVYINTQAYFKTTLQINKLKVEFLERHGIVNHSVEVFNAKSINRGILYAADFFKSDMIALFSYHKENIKTLLMGNITEYLITKSNIPILTLNLRKTE
ncbi:universal stress protein [Roseivirga sp.]|uniref:universal stress protein n=1 Tax=Roseivirga sp. TaxID=1964215 RepID=UPI002B270C71|nr:universal stress protein [Roseivirga sp.]